VAGRHHAGGAQTGEGEKEATYEREWRRN